MNFRVAEQNMFCPPFENIAYHFFKRRKLYSVLFSASSSVCIESHSLLRSHAFSHSRCIKCSQHDSSLSNDGIVGRPLDLQARLLLVIFKCRMAGKIYGPVSNHFYEEELKGFSTENGGYHKSRLLQVVKQHRFKPY